MPNDLPTASVTGRQEWKWNQYQSTRGSRDDSTESTERQSGRPDTGASRYRRQRTAPPRQAEQSDAGSGPREQRLLCIIEDLEAKLEEKEQRIQYVIRHYERLLSERNRQLAAQDGSESDGDRRLPVLSKVRQYVVGH